MDAVYILSKQRVALCGDADGGWASLTEDRERGGKRRVWTSLCVCVRAVVRTCSFSPLWLFVTTQALACQAPVSLRFSRQENWSGWPFPPPGALPNPGMEPTWSGWEMGLPVVKGGFFNHWATWEFLRELGVDSIRASRSWCRHWRRLRTQANPAFVGCYEGKCDG